MDVDRFVATNQSVWDRLDTLTRRAGAGVSRLTPAELDELVATYQRVSTHLSLVRTTYREPALTAALTRLVARAGSVLYGIRPRSLRAIGTFFTATFPAALWHLRRQLPVSAALLLVPAAAVAIWMVSSVAALEAAGPEAARAAYVEEEFEAYYSDQPAIQFATLVTTNNIRVAAAAFAFGVVWCVPAVVVLAYNGVSVGQAAGLFANAGELTRFFALILPHGLMELTAVIIAGAAGLRLGWTLIDPGDRPRAEALTEEGRRAVAVLIGLVLLFVIAGAIEGFVTGRIDDPYLRVGIGAVVWVAFLAYAWVLGRRAAAQGLTGAIGELDRAGWAQQGRA